MTRRSLPGLDGLPGPAGPPRVRRPPGSRERRRGRRHPVGGRPRPLGVRSVFLWRRTESDCLALVGQAGPAARRPRTGSGSRRRAGPTARRRWPAAPPSGCPRASPPARRASPGPSRRAPAHCFPYGRGARSRDCCGRRGVHPTRSKARSAGPWATCASPRPASRTGRPTGRGDRASWRGCRICSSSRAKVILGTGRKPAEGWSVEYVHDAGGRARGAVPRDRADDSPVLGRVLGRHEQVASFDGDLRMGRTLWSEQAAATFGLDRTDAPVPRAGSARGCTGRTSARRKG